MMGRSPPGTRPAPEMRSSLPHVAIYPERHHGGARSPCSARPRRRDGHPFGPSTGYELAQEGRRYPPKAAIGLAHRHHAGRILRPEEFSGGEAPGQTNYALRELGFAVEKEGGETKMSESEAGPRPGGTGPPTRWA